MRCAIVLAVALLLLAIPARADTVISQGTLSGTFVGVEYGDYEHFLMHDKSGKKRSFFVKMGDVKLGEILDNPQVYRGRRIRVNWRKVRKYIPESGGMMTIDQVTAVKLL